MTRQSQQLIEEIAAVYRSHAELLEALRNVTRQFDMVLLTRYRSHDEQRAIVEAQSAIDNAEAIK